MNDNLKVLCDAYCAGEYALAEQKALSLPVNSHTTGVRLRAMKLVESLAAVIESNGYEIFMYVNEGPNASSPSTKYPDVPLYERGAGYFALFIGGGGIAFIPKTATHDSAYSTPSDVARFQSGRIEDEGAFVYFLEEIKPAWDAVV